MTEYKLNDDLIYGAGFSRNIPSGDDSYDYWQSTLFGHLLYNRTG